MNSKPKLYTAVLMIGLGLGLSSSTQAFTDICETISYADFTAAANQAYEDTNQFGFGLPMWATLVDATGKICWVYSVKGEVAEPNTGQDAGNNAWLGSRVISAQKANTANAFSLDGLAISSGAVYVAVLPGGSLYGLQHSNPVDATQAYKGPAQQRAEPNDPLRFKNVGGINVFGGGVALYDGAGIKVGAVGVSGDTSCRDHTMAYRLRGELGLDNQPNDDSLTLVAVPAALFEHPLCGVNDPDDLAFGAVQ
jgi:uncharacterized protein GlcG (DUF336 family)